MDLQLFSPANIIFSQPAITCQHRKLLLGGSRASHLPVGVFTAAVSASLISLVGVGFLFFLFFRRERQTEALTDSDVETQRAI